MKQTRTRERSHHETREGGSRPNGNRSRTEGSKSNGSKKESPWSKEPRTADSRPKRARTDAPWSKESRPKRQRTNRNMSNDRRSNDRASNDAQPNWKPEGSWTQDSKSTETKPNNYRSERPNWQNTRSGESRTNGSRTRDSWSRDTKDSRNSSRNTRSNDARPQRSGSSNSWSKDSRPNRSRNEGNRSRNNRGKGKYGQKQKGFDISKYESHGNEEHVVVKYTNEHKFADFNLHPDLLDRIQQKGYTNPTEIQDKAILPSMTGKDLIGVAGTGTGKTATFLIPIIQELLVNPTHNKALIIAPTRELATQIFDEFRDLTRGLNLFSTCLIGGNPVHKSIKDLSRPNHIIIGTPGRLADMSNRGHLRFNKFETLVLDEFDRMLDMGFVDEVRDINASMTNKKQTFLFSATMDKSIKSIVDAITKDPIVVMATAGIRPSTSIKQEVLRVPSDKKKIDFLTDIISEWDAQKILVFCTTKRKVDQVHRSLHSSRITTDLIHGDKSQRAREVALRKFKSGKIDVLVATDVVARGIDVNDVSLVINYEIPHDYTDYIHRIGRTGRAGKLGKAITLID